MAQAPNWLTQYATPAEQIQSPSESGNPVTPPAQPQPQTTAAPQQTQPTQPAAAQPQNFITKYATPAGGNPSDEMPEPSVGDYLRAFARGAKKVTIGLNPGEEEFEQLGNQTPGENIAEKGGEGAAFAAPFSVFDPWSSVSGAASSAASEAVNQYASGHPILAAGAGLLGGISAAPVLSNVAEFIAKGARSIPEQFGKLESPVNQLYHSIYGGIINQSRAAGMNGSWPALMQVQNALREGLGGSGNIRQAEESIYSAVENKAQSIANNLGPDLTHQELGEAISGTAGQRAEQIRTEIDSMYNTLGNIVPKATALFPSNFYNNLLGLTRRYAGAPALQQVFGSSAPRTLEALQTDLINSPNLQIPYQVLQNVRTDIGESIEKGMLNPNVNVKELRQLYRSLTQDMEGAYTNTNNLHGLRAFQTVNAAAEHSFDTLERTLQPYLKLGIEPETITTRLLAQAKKGSTRIDDLVSQLNNIDPGVKNMVMGYVLRDLGTDNQGLFSPVRFWNNYQSLSPEARSLFPKAQQLGIEDLAKLSGLVKESYGAFNASHTSGNLNILNMIGSAIKGLTTAAGVGAGAMAGSHGGQGIADLALAGGAAGYGVGHLLAPLAESSANSMLAKLWTNRKFNIWLATQAPDLSPDKVMTRIAALAGQAPNIVPGLNYLTHYINGNTVNSPNSGRGFAWGGYAELAPNNPNGYAQGGEIEKSGGGPGAQWVPMDEGYAEGGDVGPAATIPSGPVAVSKLVLDPSVSTKGWRPFAAGEYLLNKNPDQGWSSEMSNTVQMPDGSWSVVPGLWLNNGKPIHLDEDQSVAKATQFEKKTKQYFPRFHSEAEANKYSDIRENNWQNVEPGDKSVKTLYQPSIGLAEGGALDGGVWPTSGGIMDYVHGGILDDSRPFYNPQLPGVSMQGFAQGGEAGNESELPQEETAEPSLLGQMMNAAHSDFQPLQMAPNPGGTVALKPSETSKFNLKQAIANPRSTEYEYPAFHGNGHNADIEAFRPVNEPNRIPSTSEIDAGKAIFFSKSPPMANDFAMQGYKPIDFKGNTGEEYGGRDEHGVVYPVRLNMQNPMIVENLPYNQEDYSNALDQALSKGHDSVIFRNTRDSYNGYTDPKGIKDDVYAVFDPRQVKSIFAKEFDQNSPLLSKSDGGLIGTNNGGPPSGSEIGEYASGGSVESRIEHVESGNNPIAKNPRSSASGVGQFLDSTWVNLMHKYHPEISNPLAYKNDRAMGEEMVHRYAEENMNFLQKNGVPITPGNVYLAHFLGPAGAVKLAQLDPNMPMTQAASMIFGNFANRVIEANPFLRNKSVAGLQAWAATKMGDSSVSPFETASDQSNTENDSFTPVEREASDQTPTETEPSRPQANPKDVFLEGYINTPQATPFTKALGRQLEEAENGPSQT